MKRRNFILFFRTHRRAVIVSGCVALLLLIASYGAYSLQVWSQYEAAYGKWEQEVKAQLDIALKLPVSTAAEQEKKYLALKKSSDSITSRQSVCEVNGLIAWQGVFSSLKKQYDACNKVKSTLTTLGIKITALTDHLANEQALASILSDAVLRSGKVTEGDFEKQVNEWHSALEKTKDIKSSFSFMPVKTAASEKLTTLENAWKALVAAHTAKDRIKYQEAIAHLTDAYGALSSVNDTNNQQYSQLTSVFQNDYGKAFNT